MNRVAHVAAPPLKPLMIFDGDCGFCALWIKRWRQSAGDAVDYLPFQDPRVAQDFPEIPREAFMTAVHLIETDGTVSTGARAVFGALAHNPAGSRLLRWYESLPPLAKCGEFAYRFIAGHRPLFSCLTRVGWGRQVERPTHLLTRWIFLRGLGAIYLMAFMSLWVQIGPLIGSNGILPAEQFMAGAKNHFDSHGVGLDRFRELPTLCWFGAGDSFLRCLCAAGAALSLLLVAGIAPRLVLILLWMVYLSLSVVGQTFLSFQWDTLLLETGFFAIFFAPHRWLPNLAREPSPSRASLWLLRWLLFRLMFQSGVTKLVYDDPTWLNWTALTFHYETQPLPTWIGWHAHQLPLWFQKLSCGVMYFIEIVLPFLFFAPRRLRFVAAGGTVLLQVLISFTGNYNFFNLLTALLCVPLLDDFALGRFFPRLTLGRQSTGQKPSPNQLGRRLRVWMLRAFAALVVLVTSVQMFANYRVPIRWPKPVAALTTAVAPFRTLNSYGLFRVMTRPRYEIIIEGSRDGSSWQPYEFRWKPGDVKRRPGFVQPHQPRLDWQMWFAALGEARNNPWFVNFCVRLLHGSPEAQSLLQSNPFPEQPPRYIRATLYEYHFTDRAGRRVSGDWWRRERVREYLPPISLRSASE